MNFTLKQIAVFDAIAQTGSVSHAASQLALTQSAASMALAQLEQQLGQPLFERIGRRLVLNSWGHWLRPRARRLLLDASQIEQGFKGQHLFSGELMLGISQTIAEILLPGLVCRLEHEVPQLRLIPQVSNSEHVLQSLLSHELNVGVIEGRCDDSRMQLSHWCDDHLVIVANARHPLAQQPAVSLAELSQARWVLRESGSGTREIFMNAIYGKLSKLNIWREFSHVPTILALVGQSNYLSCLPERVVTKDNYDGKLAILKVPDLNIMRQFHFVWRKDSGNDPLRDCLLEQAQLLLSDNDHSPAGL
ncbi:LysR substrate-binding domain-containing protein [Celerinatantimonas sp. YJH-8]|uniref:LysR substrate-binding domain-containing protein n=1 Tax=Celerinatantimonas sp. YJH-8 TaxID=3228714 RepID=UPI0038C931CD